MITEEVRAVTPMDELEHSISMLPRVEFPVKHLMTPGIYVRTTTLPANSILTSLEHETEHPFVVLSGIVEVRSEFENITYEGPVVGVTKPGTKRVLYAHTDTVWLTIHANPEGLEDPDEIGERITKKFDNPLFEDKSSPRLNQWREHQPERQIK